MSRIPGSEQAVDGAASSAGRERRENERDPMILTDDEFKLFSQIIYNESGITLRETKKLFLQTRLQKRLQISGLTSYYRYYKLLTDTAQGKRELLDLVDSVTINETSFFRNRPQFDLLADIVLPDLKKRKISDMKLRFWSAGCSRGQEPYSIAMSVLNGLEFPGAWDVKILASDISLRVIESAQRGLYTEHEVESIAPQYREQYFAKRDGQYEVSPQVRKLVVFDYHNLKFENGLRGFDAVFCRNVMIYFDQEEQRRVIERLHRVIADGGYLFLGHTESIQGLTDKFRFIYHNKGAVYQKVG
jgi:chemotaxis protein methyltransferase CheR